MLLASMFTIVGEDPPWYIHPDMKKLAALISAILIALPVLAYQVTLAWDPSPDPEVGAYRVYWGVQSRTYTNHVEVGGRGTTSVTLTNLPAGVTYFFAATAVATNGIESDYSNEASTYLVPQPHAPTGIRITVTGSP